ncbi:MAG: AgmX/PglI C-terminal domain-containing protein [Deltaproteobacteria bacterium]|nr:AgmX/PglI C-terminal domain-containing protein [Deltaproteobacteria bacterium]
MSSEQSERDRLIIALRRDLPLLVLAGLGLWGFLDLRCRIDRSAERPVAGGEVEPAAGKTDEVAEDEPPVQPQVQPSVAPEPDSSWGCAGKVSTEALAKTLREHGGSVVECYRGLLSVLPGAEGTYFITMQVGADGSVMDARVGGTLRDGQLDECVFRALSAWKFTPFEGGGCAVATVPYVLNPENAFN